MALPKLNLQFLTPLDYLLRNFNLFRLEATYEIREDVADVLSRVGAGMYAPPPVLWLKNSIKTFSATKVVLESSELLQWFQSQKRALGNCILRSHGAT